METIFDKHAQKTNNRLKELEKQSTKNINSHKLYNIFNAIIGVFASIAIILSILSYTTSIRIEQQLISTAQKTEEFDIILLNRMDNLYKAVSRLENKFLDYEYSVNYEDSAFQDSVLLNIYYQNVEGVDYALLDE